MVECATITVLIAFFVVTIITYWLLEFHYFMRILFCYLHSRFVKKKLDILDTSMYSSVCLTTDIDILLFHMNNARYLREVDFARTDFYNRTGLWQKIREKGGLVYQGGTSIRYRRFIRLFSLYHITSRIVYWDQNSIYMEHRFITKRDNFVRAIVYGKQKVIKCNVEEVITELMKTPATKKATEVRQKPECPSEIRLWIESTNVSSNKLRENVV
ncbi:hypothetical protein PGB90_009650 [Kerria lacca]